MKTTKPAFLIAALSSALAISGCAPLPPGESGPFTNGNAGAAAGAINQAASGMSGEALATGASVNMAALATVHIIATHEASVRQRQLAQERARAASRKLGKTPASLGRPGRRPRYLAVETVKDAQTAPGAAKAIMIWDTSAQEIVGNNVYDISEAPPTGARVKFETYAAEYVGVGL